MKNPNGKTGARDATALHSLERWRTAQLDSAAALHAQRQTVVTERADAVTKVQGLIDESQDLARAHVTQSHVLSVDSLTRIRHYTSAQVENLQQADASLIESKQAAAQSHAAMCRKFEEHAAVERLLLRRRQEAGKNASRQEQKRLDDQALLRSATDIKARLKRNYQE